MEGCNIPKYLGIKMYIACCYFFMYIFIREVETLAKLTLLSKIYQLILHPISKETHGLDGMSWERIIGVLYFTILRIVSRVQ